MSGLSLRIDAWLTAERVRGLAAAAVMVQVLLFGIFIAGTHDAFVKLPRPTTTDFASFYAAGVLADRGQAPAAYDVPTHRVVEEQVTAPGIDYKFFLNPPVFLLICAPLAKLPYLTAFVVFEGATFLLWLALTTRIAGGGGLAALLLMSVPAVYWAAGWGQNAFLSAGLMAAGTLLLRRFPWAAGVAFGALCFKPHFGILIPVALVAARQWRAILGAAVTVAGLVGLSAAVFGVATWRAFFDMALHARGTIESGRIQLSGHVDPGGVLRLLGMPPVVGWIVWVVSASVAALLVWRIWWRVSNCCKFELNYAVAMALLVAGTLMAMPFALFYDLVMASVAAAWLTRAARLDGWRPGEKTLLLALFICDLLAFPAASLLRMAIGAAIAPVLAWLAWRRSTLYVRM